MPDRDPRPTILLTGFNPFAGAGTNPSELVVRTLAARSLPFARVLPAVLPTEYVAAGRRLRALLRREPPAAIVALGLAADRNRIEIERVALNLDDSETPDNLAVRRAGRAIVADGPVGYWSTLPVVELRRALRAKGYPAEISNHAGAFLCNHIF